MRERKLVVAGVMSGTSADGINVALIEIDGRASKKPRHSNSMLRNGIRLLGHSEYPYPAKVRAAVLSAMNASQASVADLARLNTLLGELYADAVRSTQLRHGVKVKLIGCHGQTLYHQGQPESFLGRKITTTWQTGEAAVIADRVGVPVVSDFRPADMAAGGKGAPLVPYLDYLWFRDVRIGRIIQNMGGIANLTAIPAGARPEEVFAFDTGPGNMVIDAVTQELFARPFDRDGKIAASGEVIEKALAKSLRQEYFLTKPPKTAGREEFGRDFVQTFLGWCGRKRRNQDVVATATNLTARSIGEAIARFVVGASGARSSYRELVLSGGGVRNGTLVAMLAEQVAPLGIVIRFSDEFGLPSAAKEAVAFAVMAYETWNRRPSNLPSATGAKRTAVLGKISYA